MLNKSCKFLLTFVERGFSFYESEAYDYDSCEVLKILYRRLKILFFERNVLYCSDLCSFSCKNWLSNNIDLIK